MRFNIWFRYLFFPYRWHNQQIGAGIGLAAAALGGGLFAYKKHEEHKEQVREFTVIQYIVAAKIIYLFFFFFTL